MKIAEKPVGVVAALGVLALGLAAAGSVRAEARRIHVLEQATNVTYVPIGSLVGNSNPNGAQGDYLAWDDPVVDPTTGARVGNVIGQCTLVDVAQQVYTCTATMTLTGRGALNFQGAFGATGSIGQGTMVGGTGQFFGAFGYDVIHVTNGGAIDDWEITLVR